MVFYVSRGNDTVTSTDITDALAYTPVNKAGDTVSGSLTVTGVLSGNGAVILGDAVGDAISVLGTPVFYSYIDMPEQSTPSAPGTNTGRLFCRDNGSGKTQLCIIFNTGAVQVISTQP